MSEEEKKAILRAGEHITDPAGNYLSNEHIETLLNLIDKQQKEIEREEQYTELYKDLCDKQQKEIEYYKYELEKESSIWTKIEKVNDYISKDKVREILFDIGTLHDGGFIKVKIIRERLEELLEE